MSSSPTAKKAKTEPSADNIPAPTSKGWGKSEWEKWSNAEKARYNRLCKDNMDSEGLRTEEGWQVIHEYIDKRNDAVDSAAPDEITVKVSIEEITTEAAGTSTTCNKNVSEIIISKQGSVTFRSILDRYCQEHNIERDDYHWSHKPKVITYPGKDNLMNQTDVKCFFDFWGGSSTIVKRFVDETTFMPEIVGQLKKPPAPKPSVQPTFDKLKCLPPDGNASREEWKKWHRKNSCGCGEFWMQRSEAIEYSCPDEIDMQLKGLSHEHTVKVKADDPVSVGLVSYCESTTGTDFAVTTSEVIFREYGDDPHFIDAQTTSARRLFNGYAPLKLEVVYRDTKRTEAEIESIQGSIPEGYKQFLGAGYRLSDTEQPWFITQNNGLICTIESGRTH